ncbi:uncharacterized protein A4U43_C08F5140 [Asparagus officinalis]|nr:uncharacterized protein A4U43_C08F5140 [Asparagus officinalis]
MSGPACRRIARQLLPTLVPTVGPNPWPGRPRSPAVPSGGCVGLGSSGPNSTLAARPRGSQDASPSARNVRVHAEAVASSPTAYRPRRNRRSTVASHVSSRPLRRTAGASLRRNFRDAHQSRLPDASSASDPDALRTRPLMRIPSLRTAFGPVDLLEK